MLADDVEPGATGDVLGILVTTGPVTPEKAGLGDILKHPGSLLYVEQIAITAPSLRGNCPESCRRKPRLLATGQAPAHEGRHRAKPGAWAIRFSSGALGKGRRSP